MAVAAAAAEVARQKERTKLAAKKASEDAETTKKHEGELQQHELGRPIRIRNEGCTFSGSFDDKNCIRQRGFGEVRVLSRRLLLVRIRPCPSLKWDAMNGSESWQILSEVFRSFRSSLGFFVDCIRCCCTCFLLHRTGRQCCQSLLF